MPRCLPFAGLLCAALLAQSSAPAAAPPPCAAARPHQTTTAVYPVADLVIPVDTRPVTVHLGREAKATHPRPRKDVETTHDQLIQLIMATVASGTWEGQGGGTGKIDYRAADLALVVTHSAAAQAEVDHLLEALRRQQDVTVCLEASVLRMAEQTFERIGVDFGTSRVATRDQNGVSQAVSVAQTEQFSSVTQSPRVTCFDRQRVEYRFAEEGIEVAVRVTPTVSADRRFVRLSLRLRRDGAEDETVKVVLPTGASVALPVGAVLHETRQEFAVPVLSRIPYVNRLFKNVGYGRETERVFLVVTPRVIVQEDAAE